MWVPLVLAFFCFQETRTESWPSGAKKAEYETAFDQQGVEVKHGPYQAFFENGQLEAEGAFALGEEEGPWVYFHPNGTKAATGRWAGGLRSGPWETWYPDGQRESKGSYVRGARSKRWTFWREDGTKDLDASGLYVIEVYRSKEDGRHYRGYIVDNKRQGTWTSYWPDGMVQLEGHFVAGEREGRWVFTHPDGVPSSLLFTGDYSGGAWAGRVPLPEPPPFDSAAFPPIAPAPAGWPDDHEELVQALRDAIANQALPPGVHEALNAAGVPAVPVVLEVLRTLDPERPADRAAMGFLEHQALRPLCAGHSLSGHGRIGPRDAPAARELVRAWLSLWALTRGDRAFWEVDVPGPTRSRTGLRSVLQDPPILERDARYNPDARPTPKDSSGELADDVPYAYSLRFGRAKRARLRTAAAGTKESVARALEWLAAHQHPDGLWSNAQFTEECARRGEGSCGYEGNVNYDVGATGLALLAFLGDGHGSTVGDYTELVRHGLDWLVKSQTSEGLIGTRATHDFLYGHAIATAALCEAHGLGDETVREAAEKALVFLQLGRHPEAGWRYDVPATEPGDTSVTGWAVNALIAARHAGLGFDPATFKGTLTFLDLMTEPRTGRVGYTDRGELSARNSSNKDFPMHMGEAMTAVGLLVRLQLGLTPATTPLLKEHAKLLSAKPPTVHPEYGADQYYWYYATHALHEFGGKPWDAWEKQLRKAVVLSQERGGEREGSWAPIGPWGYAMGRVCTTALMTLTLECPYRYPRALEKRR